jgi:hypothetical protein
MKAMEIVQSVRAPFWDALIAACMLEHGVEVIVTENEKDFKNIRHESFQVARGDLTKDFSIATTVLRCCTGEKIGTGWFFVDRRSA